MSYYLYNFYRSSQMKRPRERIQSGENSSRNDPKHTTAQLKDCRYDVEYHREFSLLPKKPHHLQDVVANKWNRRVATNAVATIGLAIKSIATSSYEIISAVVNGLR